VAYSLQIVSSRLLDTLVRRDGSVSSRTREVLAVFIRNVLTFAVFVALGKAKVNDVDVIFGGFRAADQEIIRLDIPMNDPLFMHFFNALDHLDRNHEDSL